VSLSVRYSSSYNVVPKLIEYRIKELEKHLPREPNVYYVTDLVRCSLKREFEFMHPALSYTHVLNGRTFLGEVVHKGLERILKEIFGDAVRTEEEELERERVVDVNGTKYVVRGRVDAIIGVDTGIEIKETVSESKLPFQHHVEQTMIYNWLYSFRHTILLYITPDGIFEFEVDDRMTETEVIKRIKEKKTPRYPWECRYCEYTSICPIHRALIENRT